MSKVLKRFLLILIVLIGAILLIPKAENANTWIDYGKEDIIFSNDLFSYTNVFCIEKSMTISVGSSYELSKHIYESGITSGSTARDRFLAGLASILSHEGSPREQISGGLYISSKDPVQVALWAYLQNTAGEYDISIYGKDLQKIMITQASWGLKVDDNNGKLTDYEYWENIEYSFDDDNGTAYKYYKEAMSIFTGAKDYEWSLNCYIYTHDDYQNIIIVESASGGEPDESEPLVPKVTQPSERYGCNTRICLEKEPVW